MAKSAPDIDLLVLGDHPAAFLAAALLAHDSKLRVGIAPVPGLVHPDRLVLVHPDLFKLHPMLGPLARKLSLKQVYGTRFLADDSNNSEFRSKGALSGIGSLKEIRAAMEKLAAAQGVQSLKAKEITIRRIDEKGLEVSLGQMVVRPTALILADPLPPSQSRILGLPEEWDADVIRRYSYIRLKNNKNVELSGRPTVPMSLNLRNQYGWAWLLPGEKQIQLCVDQSIQSVAHHPPAELLRFWADVLAAHGVLRSAVEIDPSAVESIDIPAGGALAHEGVANRTLLVGPAGGFFAATTEDIYPNCWSAVFAADTLKKALKQTHLQDALHVYRHVWRTTLGNYLRGPQQNLRFLLPLIYRNNVMTQRMAEGILLGRSK